MRKSLPLVVLSLLSLSCSSLNMGPVQSRSSYSLPNGQFIKKIIIHDDTRVSDAHSQAAAHKIHLRLQTYLENELQARNMRETKTGQLTLEVFLTNVRLGSGAIRTLRSTRPTRDRLDTIVSLKNTHTGELITEYPVLAERTANQDWAYSSARRSDHLARHTARLIAESLQ